VLREEPRGQVISVTEFPRMESRFTTLPP
jgi:hypothetical protein